ncbi:hypothetical protein [Streptomyces sp. NPDC059175]|uniref:hypothetical protein n=1 Tax=unclassified Streptomyces TaxID=2593676 RepID=UPI00367E2856
MGRTVAISPEEHTNGAPTTLRSRDKALELGASVHMPRIGCGLAGGRWSRVEPLVVERLVARGVAVTVYDHGR